MIRLCNQCNCELTSQNSVKKDARRYRKMCRSCFAVKRNALRLIKLNNQTQHLNTLIEKKIIEIDYINKNNVTEKCYECESPYVEFGLISRAINGIKNVIARIYNGLQSKYSNFN